MENQNDILKRVRLLMEYDMSMTLTENLVLISEQAKLPSNIGYGQQVQNQKISSVQYPKGYVESKGWFVDSNKATIKGTSVKEIVKNLRDFFFESPVGFAADIIISVAGVEVGGPLIMKALNFAFLANDLDTYYATTTPEYRQKGFMEKFFDESNKSFQDVITDLMVVGTLGVVRGLSATKNLIKTSFHKISEIASKSKSFIDEIKTVLSKIPKIGEWLGSKLGMVSDFLTSLITKPKPTTMVKQLPNKFLNYVTKFAETVPGNLPKAGIQAFLGVLLFHLGEMGFERLMKSDMITSLIMNNVKPNGEISSELVIKQQAYDVTIQKIVKDNPTLKGPFEYVDGKNGIVNVGKPPKKYILVTDYDYTLKPYI